MLDDILTALGRELRDQERMHPRICPLAQTLLMKSKASAHELEPRAWEGRNEVVGHPVQLVGLTCLPDSTSNIRRRK